MRDSALPSLRRRVALATSVAACWSMAVTARADEAPAPDRAASPTPNDADDPGSPPFGGELRLQMGIGGEKVADVEYSDGSSSDLRLGTYAFVGLGGIYSPWMSGPHAIELELLGGFGSWSTGPENTDDRIALARFPIDLLAFYRHQLSDADGGEMFVRGGAGGTWHFVSGISGSGNLADVDLDVRNAPGLVVEAAFVYTIVSAGVRYTLMEYEIAGIEEKLDASSLGFFLALIAEPGLF